MGLAPGEHSSIHIVGRKKEGKEGGWKEGSKGGRKEYIKVRPWCSSEKSQKTELLIGETSSSGSFQREHETFQVAR